MLDVKAGGGGASALVVVVVVVVVVDDEVEVVEVTGGTTATLLALRGSAATFGFPLAPLTSVFVFVEEEVMRALPAGRELVVVVELADFAAAAPCAIGLKPVRLLPPPHVELAKFGIPGILSCEPAVAFGIGSVVDRASVRDADRDEDDVLVDPLRVRV